MSVIRHGGSVEGRSTIKGTRWMLGWRLTRKALVHEELMDFWEHLAGLQAIVNGDLSPHDEALNLFPHLRITLGIRWADEAVLHGHVSAIIAQLADLNLVGCIIGPAEGAGVDVLSVVIRA